MKRPKQLIRLADSSEFLDTLPDNCFDAIVTDPPYNLIQISRGGSGRSNNPDTPAGRHGAGSGGFMGLSWDATGISFDPEFWAKCLRVLKPGGHLLSFGGSRTWHRIAVAIEDAGFELRDTLLYMFGVGFPKSADISKMIDKAAGAKRKAIGRNPNFRPGKHADLIMRPMSPGEAEVKSLPATNAAKQWEGFGSALKPAYEPILMFRKPLSEPTLAANVLRWGTGGLNIDGTRLGISSDDLMSMAGRSGRRTAGQVFSSKGDAKPWEPTSKGRWPANLILDETAAEMVGKASRFFLTAKASRLERELGLLDLEPVSGAEAVHREEDSAGLKSPRAGAGRSSGVGVRNLHPT